MLVSGVMVVALNAVGASFAAQRSIDDRARGQLLANDLMVEILGQAYEDPNETVAFGLEASEIGGANRALYDDVDDYQGVTDSPPKLKDGSAVEGFTGWSRSVSMIRADPNNLNSTLLPPRESGVKTITVTVKHGKVTVAKMVAIKARGSPAGGQTGIQIDMGIVNSQRRGEASTT